MARELEGDPVIRAIKETYEREPELISVERLSKLLNQGTNTTYRQLNDGEIPGIYLPSGKWLILSQAIADWLISLRKNNIRKK